jgi:hypothetical protein
VEKGKPAVQADTGKPKTPAPPPAPVPFASFTLMDAARLGTLKFHPDPSAFGSRLVLRSLSSPTEHSRLVPSAPEFIWDSLPEGWYAVDYFRDANGDGIWNPGSLSPWSVQEPYVMWRDSVEVKPNSLVDGNTSAAPASNLRKKLSWPPSW